jgi:hypothetical protein
VLPRIATHAGSPVAAGEALATHVLPAGGRCAAIRLPGLVTTFVVGDEARTVEALRGRARSTPRC